jgi:hypothetical protein
MLTRYSCSYDGVDEFPQWLIEVRFSLGHVLNNCSFGLENVTNFKAV